MKSRKSLYIIVSISIFTGILHFVIGPNYQGPFKLFVQGYLIDILLPLNIYLLLQISLRKILSTNKSRIIASIGTLIFGIIVELLQSKEIEFLGTTYDPLDILMYAIGVGLGVIIDLTIINKYEILATKD